MGKDKPKREPKKPGPRNPLRKPPDRVHAKQGSDRWEYVTCPTCTGTGKYCGKTCPLCEGKRKIWTLK